MLKNVSIQEFEGIYKHYYSRLYHYAYDFVDDEGASDDIVSEVFSTLWRERAHIRMESLTTYLFVSVRNKSLNYIRHQKSMLAYEAYCKASFTEEDENYWQTMDERIAEMKREIDKMSEKTRFVLEQCYLENHTYKEVAQMMGISTEGVKKHIVKAFAILRKHFNVKKR